MHQFVEPLEQRRLLSVTIAPIDAAVSPGAKTVLVPIHGTTDTTGITYRVSTSTGSITATQVTGLKFMQMNISIDGVDQTPLVFALFGGYTPKTVAAIVSLVNRGYYNGKNFHRIIPDFMAQGGKAGTADTTSTIDDEFNPNLIFDSKYLLAMANANSGYWTDSGSTEFFITAEQTRWLDFRHTIFGMLVSGQDTFANIMAKAGTDNAGTPTGNVVITSASMITDTTDTVVAVKAAAGSSGTLTIQATDAGGATSTSAAAISGITDTTNDPPYLNYLPSAYNTFKNVPIRFTASATDLEGNAATLNCFTIEGQAIPSITRSGSTFTITPPSNFTGSFYVLMTVYQGQYNATDTYDSQLLKVNVSGSPFASKNASGLLTIKGTSANDVLSLALNSSRSSIVVTLNSRKTSFALSGVKTISIDAGDGNDTVTVSSAITRNSTILGGNGNDTLQGGGGVDSIRGGTGADSINGGNGNDLIHGDAGNDKIWGSAGNDLLYGDGDNDWIDAGAGNDKVYGGSGNDLITGNTGADTLYGDAGNDTLVANDGSRDTLTGGVGTDYARWDSVDRRLDTLLLFK